MKFSICLDTVFQDQDAVSALEQVREAGVSAFEFWRWWDKDLPRIRKAKDELQLTAVACCTRFISLVDASQRDAYMQGLTESIRAAKEMDCKMLISQVGKATGISRDEARRNVIDGLDACAPLLEAEGITLVIEPINALEIPGYFPIHSQDAFDIVEAVASPKVRVLYDIYHQQITEGHLITRIVTNIDKIGHFHAAGNPGRHELSRGEINYPQVFQAIKAAGYTGYVGLEYFPADEPLKGIHELTQAYPASFR